MKDQPTKLPEESIEENHRDVGLAKSSWTEYRKPYHKEKKKFFLIDKLDLPNLKLHQKTPLRKLIDKSKTEKKYSQNIY